MPTLSKIKLILLALAIAGSFGGGVVLEHKIAEGRYQRLVAAQTQANLDATNKAVAEQKRLDGIATQAAQREAATQAALASLRSRQLAQVKKHVSDTRTRVPYGVVRLLDGAAGGVLADTLVLPTGKSDDALTSLGWDDLARSAGGNYSTCRSNAEQLDALIASFRASRQ